MLLAAHIRVMSGLSEGFLLLVFSLNELLWKWKRSPASDNTEECLLSLLPFSKVTSPEGLYVLDLLFITGSCGLVVRRVFPFAFFWLQVNVYLLLRFLKSAFSGIFSVTRLRGESIL